MTPPDETASFVRLDIIEPTLAEILLDQPNSPVNLINRAFINELTACLQELERMPSIRSVVVRSAKPGQFVAGADLELLRRATQATELEEEARRLQRLFDRLAKLPATSVAAIGGSAMGGGLELALACDYRAAVDNGAIQLSQAEVSLGLVPAGGGTQRLPRLIGLANGLDLILTGKRIPPKRAFKLGLLDELVATEQTLAISARRLARQGKRRPAGFDPQRWLLERTSTGRNLAFRKAREKVISETHGHYPAPLKALEAVQAGWERSVEAGLAVEAISFGELGVGEVSRNLVRLFFVSQAARKNPPAEQACQVRKLAVVGAGLMGSGIADVAAVAGLDVRLRDVDQAALTRGLANVNRLLDGAARTGRWTQSEIDVMRARTTGTTGYDGFASAQLVVEAVFEDLDLKRNVLAEIEQHVSDQCVVASNTSAIPIALIAQHAKKPRRIVGMHFFSPVHRMQLVEVIRPAAAEDWAIDTVVAVARSMGKTAIVVADGPGFYTSRVVAQMLNEADRLFEEGVDPGQIDSAMVDFGFPVGPIALFDEVGLDVAVHAGTFLAQHLPSRAPAGQAAAKLLAQGRKGRKSGAGFYSYPQGKRQDDATLHALFPERRPRAFPREEIQDRIAFAFVAEALRCLAEGVIRSPAAGDLGAVLGLGFPPFLGGPFHYVQTLGMDTAKSKLHKLADRHGEHFRPPEMLLPAAFYSD